MFVEILFFLFSIVLSMTLGLVAGIQRLHAGKKAGPRTYALVTMAATLFTLMSTQMGGDDRVAAAVLTGIGFIGAGMIMHKEGDIEGLTTAAGLWLMSAVGMAVGLGWWWQGVFVTILALLLLMWNDHGAHN